MQRRITNLLLILVCFSRALTIIISNGAAKRCSLFPRRTFGAIRRQFCNQFVNAKTFLYSRSQKKMSCNVIFLYSQVALFYAISKVDLLTRAIYRRFSGKFAIHENSDQSLCHVTLSCYEQRHGVRDSTINHQNDFWRSHFKVKILRKYFYNICWSGPWALIMMKTFSCFRQSLHDFEPLNNASSS